MKDGKQVFRLHQPGQKKQNNATFNPVEVRANPNNNQSFEHDLKVQQFEDTNVKIFLKGLYGIDGYDVRTGGKR